MLFSKERKAVVLASSTKEVAGIKNAVVVTNDGGAAGNCSAMNVVYNAARTLKDADEIIILGTLGAYDDTPIGTIILPELIINGDAGYSFGDSFSLHRWMTNGSETTLIDYCSVEPNYQLQQVIREAGLSFKSATIVATDTWHDTTGGDSPFLTKMKEIDVVGEDMEDFGYLMALSNLGLDKKATVARVVSNNIKTPYNPNEVSDIMFNACSIVSKYIEERREKKRKES